MTAFLQYEMLRLWASQGRVRGFINLSYGPLYLDKLSFKILIIGCNAFDDRLDRHRIFSGTAITLKIIKG